MKEYSVQQSSHEESYTSSEITDNELWHGKSRGHLEAIDSDESSFGSSSSKSDGRHKQDRSHKSIDLVASIEEDSQNHYCSYEDPCDTYPPHHISDQGESVTAPWTFTDLCDGESANSHQRDGRNSVGSKFVRIAHQASHGNVWVDDPFGYNQSQEYEE